MIKPCFSFHPSAHNTSFTQSQALLTIDHLSPRDIPEPTRPPHLTIHHLDHLNHAGNQAQQAAVKEAPPVEKAPPTERAEKNTTPTTSLTGTPLVPLEKKNARIEAWLQSTVP